MEIFRLTRFVNGEVESGDDEEEEVDGNLWMAL